MTTADRFNIQSQLEHLQMKYVGTGHSDISKYDWVTNHHRDTYASFIGHAPIHTYFAVAYNQSIGRVKYELLMKMVAPCGLNANKEKEEE